jgi:hypothetical protein
MSDINILAVLVAAVSSFLLWAIDTGYHTAQFVLFALVLSLWP